MDITPLLKNGGPFLKGVGEGSYFLGFRSHQIRLFKEVLKTKKQFLSNRSFGPARISRREGNQGSIYKGKYIEPDRKEG